MVFNVRFLTHHKVNGGPDDYEKEWIAEVDCDTDGTPLVTGIYEAEAYDNGNGAAIPREHWGKEIEAKLGKIEDRAIDHWRKHQSKLHS